MRFIEVPYLERDPYPTKFGPGSDKPLPPRYKLVSGRRQIVDLDKVVCADTFHGVLIGDPEASVMTNLDSEFIEFVYGENVRVVTLSPEKYLGLLLDGDGITLALRAERTLNHGIERTRADDSGSHQQTL